MDSVINALQSAVVQYPAAILLGFCIGVWLDAILRKREFEYEQIDRNKLADEIEIVARKISQIAADGAAAEVIGWEQDSQELMAQPSGTRHLTRDRATAARGRALEKYGEYHFPIETLLAKAAKCVSLDRSDLWRVSHILSSGRDIGEMARFLAVIAIELRHPQPTLPIRDRHSEQVHRAAIPPPSSS
ncbi:hypothetical protein [Enterovirga sp. CN4-39]|uniref:hypothetical protein n=1 Tax=Enterovirga sp. CN4-39 TaxID=3400910 RepID=UPI003C00A297